MNIIFQNAFMLPLLALAVAPLLLHLFARAKPPEYLFSSNEFIIRVIRESIRFRKPHDILLLILRTLIFLAVIFAFTRPLFFASGSFAGFQGKRNVVILADISASMGYNEGGQTRLASACAEISEILSGLSKSDKANIIWIKAAPKAVFPVPGTNIAFLQEELRKAAVSNQKGDAGAAMKQAFYMLKKAEGKKEIFIVSDFQKTQWEGIRNSPEEGVSVAAVRIGKETGKNRALSKMYTDPVLPIAGENVTVFCEIANYSPEPWTCEVNFKSGGTRDQHQAMIAPWGKTTSVFQCKFRETGNFPFEAAISEDSFPADNTRCGKIEVQKYLDAAVVADDQIPARYWRRALKSLPWVKVENVPMSEIKPGADLDLVMISGWDGASPELIRTLLSEGKTVFCSPGEKLPEADLANLAAGKNGTGGGAQMLMQKTEDNFGLKILKPDDKVFSIFADGKYGDPAGGILKSRFMLDSSKFPGAETLMTFGDGVPALMRFRAGQGTLFIWNIPLGPDDGNWAGRTQFLPFLSELVLSGRRVSADTDGASCRFPGMPLFLGVESAGTGKGIELKDPNGDLVPCRSDRQEGRLVLASDPVDKCGIYNWFSNGENIDCTPVNFPSEESDLRCLGDNEVKAMGVFTADNGGQVRSLHEGVELWPFLVIFALLICFIEQFVMIWAEKR